MLMLLNRKLIVLKKFYRPFINTKMSSKPDFTKNNHKVIRGNYGFLDEKHIYFFQELLGEQRVVMDLSDLEKYNVDHFMHFRGNSRLALKPKTSAEISKILSFCNTHKLAVCPYGGNTSLHGGSVPVFDEIVISMELFNNIISVDDVSGTLVCEAGCILENINSYLSDYNLMMPLDLGAKGSCQIGGNVSTNAGGLRLLRYGNLHGNVLGVEAITAQGEVLDCLSTLRKDNTGYHLKHLFIGSEGTLGLVTKVAIQCVPKPKSIHLAFLGLQKFEKVLSTVKKAKQELGEILSALEVMDAATVKMMNEHCNLLSPIGDYPFYLIVETSGSDEKHDFEKMERFLETALLQHFVLNGVLASQESKREAMWEIREKIAETFSKDGHVFSYDVSIPLEKYYELVDETRNHVGEKAHRVFGFGHLGDGNLHLQVSATEYSKELKEFIESFVYKRVAEMNGSISAEHGIGFLKTKQMPSIKSAVCLKLMKDLKDIMDPKHILNPYKVLPN